MLKNTRNILTLTTPEGISFSFPLAGPVIRMFAWLIDIIVIVGILSIIGTVLSLAGFLGSDFLNAIFLIVFFAISFGYGMVFEWFMRGQTIGKRVMRIRVMDEQGLKLKFSQVAIRNLLRLVDIMPGLYLVGGVTSLVNSNSQRLGDIAASTVVIRYYRVSEPDFDQIVGGKFNSLREYPHLAARLRQKVSPREAGIALSSLMRRDSLEPDERVNLFGEIAQHFKTKVDFPQEAIDGISDEQYIRNVVDVLFRTRVGSVA